MADSNKAFLDHEGLALYDELIKKYIKNKISTSDSGLAAEIERAEGAEADLLAQLEALANGAVKDNTDAIAILNGDADTEGSVDNKVLTAINALVNGAPTTLDTLKEISDWISNNGEDATNLVSRVAENEEKIAENAQNITDLKAYVDAQDEYYYDRITSINDANIESLFKEAVPYDSANGTVAEAIEALGENEKLVLPENSVVADDLTIKSGKTIDANGSTFSGTVTVAPDATVINAVFTGKVTIG